jgi:hypothetical protein
MEEMVEAVEKFLNFFVENSLKTNELLALHINSAMHTLREVWLILIVAREHPSADKLKTQFVAASNYLQQDGDKLFSLILVSILSLLLTFSVAYIIHCSKAPRHKTSIKKMEELNSVHPTPSPTEKEDQTQQRESRKARMESFASEQVTCICIISMFLLVD